MSANVNALTPRQVCDRDCAPGGNHKMSYDSRGDVFQCEHGVIRQCDRDTGWARWHGTFGRHRYWYRLSPFWTPRKYRRALTALADPEVESA